MERLLLKPMEAGESLGIGRSKTYALIASGELPTVRVGGCLRVPVEALRRRFGELVTEPEHDCLADDAP